MFIVNINQTRVNGIKTELTMNFSLIFEVHGDSTIFQNDWIGKVFLGRAISPGQK